jgi:serine protease Do
MSIITRKRAAVSTLVIAGSALGGAALHAGFVTTERALAADAPASAAQRPYATTPESMSLSFADLAEQVTPSVVQIEVVVPNDPNNSDERQAPQIPEEFRRFFDMPFGNQGPQQDEPRMGGGSGFLVSADGYIVTNNHVVGDADRITVTLNDHRTFTARLVGTDPTTDVAVIKIDANGLPHLAWGSSERIRVGEWIMAVGNPGFGGDQLSYTVTTGIVSAKGRPLSLIGQDLQSDPRYGKELSGYAIENFIQTDAVINPGNSGGPMVNLAGEVVGVNSAIASTDGHYQGYGFAIPSDLVKKVADDLIANGHVLRPWLGVQVGPVGPEDAEVYHLPSVTGALVQSVTDESPAAKAGFKQGDVIVAVGDQPITSGGDLQEAIAVLNQGETVSIRYWRDGREETARVRLGDAPVSAAKSGTGKPERASSASAERLGLTVEPLSQDAAQQLGYARAGGVVVSDVDPIGPAASRGVTPGLRLRKVGKAEIRTPEDVASALSSVPAGSVVTLILEAPDGSTRIANVRTH